MSHATLRANGAGLLLALLLAGNVFGTVKPEATHKEEALIAESGDRKIPLLELFSSESCSSCPPADRWFGDLAESSGLFKEFVPVAFHVDYWNYLSWKDAYSSHSATQRQIELSKRWPSPSVYTPAVVLNGREFKDWPSKSATNMGGQADRADLKISVYQKDGSGFRVVVKPSSTAEASSRTKVIRVQMVSLFFDVKTKVTSGENSGRELKHNFLVSDWETMTCNSQPCEKDFHLSQLEKKIPSSRRAVAVWIETLDSPVALQSTGAFLK